MSENGEIYTAGKNFTLPPAVTAGTNFTSAIAKLKPLSLFISLLLMLKEAFDNARIEK